MFRPIFLLPGAADGKERKRLRDRWDSRENDAAAKKVLEMIRAGGGEDFLQGDYESGTFSMLDHFTDLRGIHLFKEDIDFPRNTDNFEAIEFGFAEFWHSKFTGACFSGSYFEFARMFNCAFVECTFGFTHFFGCTLDRVQFINCEFREGNTFVNCDMKTCAFHGVASSERLFFECRFDEKTRISKPVTRGVATLPNADRAEFFKGIREAYEAGEVSGMADDFFLAERQSVTRYNTPSVLDKGRGFFVEALAGYGVRPLRVLAWMAAVLAVYSVVFAAEFGAQDGLMLSAGAFFTFGGSTDVLKLAGVGWKVAYVVESFFGIALMATFITVLARKAFRQ